MKRFLRPLTAVAAALSVCLSIFARDNSKWEHDAQLRKADYIYGEAQRQNTLGHSDASYELYQRAYAIDSTNSNYHSELGLYYLSMTRKDEALIHEATRLLRKKFEADPTDFSNAYYYSQMLGNTGNIAKKIEVLHIVDSIYPKRTDIALTYVDALIESEDSINLNNALKRLDNLQVTVGHNMEFTRRKTVIFALRNDSINALKEINDAINASPLNPECYSFAGRYFEINHKSDSALSYYKKACEVNPESGSASFVLAQYYKNIGDTINYSHEIDRALLETNLNIEDKHEILLDYTRDLINDSTYQPYVNTIFNRVIEKHQREPSIRNLYADYLSVQEDYKAAVEQMGQVLDMQPEEPSNWIRTAILFSQLSDYNSAITTLERALKYHDANPDIHQVLGSSLYLADTKNNCERAISEMLCAYELTDSVDINTRSDYLSIIGDFYYSAEQIDSAGIYYRKAIELNPDNNLAKNNYAYHLSESSNNPEQLAKAEKLSFATVTAEPDNATYLDTYAWILFKQQDYKRAKEYIDRAFTKIVDNNGEDAIALEYYIHAGDIYFWNQLPDKAVEFWSKALEMDPENELLARKVKFKTYFHE